MVVSLLSGCGSSGSNNPADSQSGGGVTTSSLKIAANSWKYARGNEYVIFTFSESRALASYHCFNGLVASVSVPARVTAETVEILGADRKEINQNGQYCEAHFDQSPPAHYTIEQSGNLNMGGEILTPAR